MIPVFPGRAGLPQPGKMWETIGYAVDDKHRTIRLIIIILTLTISTAALVVTAALAYRLWAGPAQPTCVPHQVPAPPGIAQNSTCWAPGMPAADAPSMAASIAPSPAPSASAAKIAPRTATARPRRSHRGEHRSRRRAR